MDQNQIKQIRLAAEAILAGQDCLVASVVARLDEVGNRTHDGAVTTLKRILDKRQSPLITQAEFSGLWEKVAGLGNPELFREEFGDLLVGERAAPDRELRDHSVFVGGIRDSGEILPIGDATKTAELEAAFNGKTSVRFLQAGRDGIQADLLDAGFKGAKVEIAASNGRFVVFAAAVDGAAGPAKFLLPAEIRNNNVLLPSVFYTNRFADLTQDNLRKWAASGEAGTGDPVALLDTLASLAGESAEPSDWNTVTASGYSSGFDLPVETSSEITDVGFAPVTAELLDAVPDLEQVLLENGVAAGPKAVAAARTMLSGEFVAASLRHDQIKIEAGLENGFVLGTHIYGPAGRQHISVPVEVVGQAPLFPSVFQAGNQAFAFTEANLKAVAAADNANFNAGLTSLASMGFRDLYAGAMKCASMGQHGAAEEYMAAIQQTCGDDYYRAAFQDMVELLKQASQSADGATDLDRYYAKFEAEAAERDRDVKMQQNLSLINLI
jgi:hypothetical protein